MIDDETVQRALEAIKTPASQDYFFSKLQSPEWIEPLGKKGLFAPAEPPPERSGGQYYSRWSASEYLVRMAPLSPELVAQTFEQMKTGNNPWVHRDIVSAALQMPVPQAARLAKVETKWLKCQERVWPLVMADYGRLVVRLAEEGETGSAIDLMSTLFEIRPDPAQSPRGWGEPLSRLDGRDYGRVLQQVFPNLTKVIPKQLFDLLCGLLDRAVDASHIADSLTPPQDYSEFWRPAIEEHEQNHGHALRDALVAVVRDVATELAKQSCERRSWVIERLEQMRWHVFHRIAMHIICEVGQPALDLARPRILKSDNLHSSAFRHEYSRLLGTFFGMLAASDQNQFLRWIEDGPTDAGEWAAFLERETGIAQNDEGRQAHSDRWKYLRVHPIRESLPEDWKRRYAEWATQFGKLRLTDFAIHCQFRCGEASPRTAEELAGLDIKDLIVFLRSWRHSGEWDQPTIGGLAQALQRAVAANAVRFAEHATEFENLPPEYVSSVLEGLRDAQRSETALSWLPILGLCEWVTRQPRDIAWREGLEYRPGEPHPDWKLARGMTADLIEKALHQEEGGIPFELRERVWAILAVLAEDPHPTPQDEAERDAHYDPFTASLNTTRGKAMHAVVQYVLWVARNSPRPDTTELRLAAGMEEIPEARDLLVRHIDPSQDPSLTIRSVLGHYFPFFAAIDPDWASVQRSLIFPACTSEAPFWTAAWNAYVRFNSVYTNVFSLLSQEYARAIEQCRGGADENRDVREANDGLAEHLMILFGRGSLVIEQDGLVARFFSIAPVVLQVHAIDFIGRILSHEQAPPKEVIDRFKNLWQWLAEAARGGSAGDPKRRRLAAFGRWFTAGAFEAPWSICALEEAIKLAGCIDDPSFVIESLDRLASELPNNVLRCLREIIRSEKECWEISASQDAVQHILQATLRHPDESTREEARRIIDDLVARGFFSYRNLLSEPDSDASGTPVDSGGQ